jgi:hypothetical protein
MSEFDLESRVSQQFSNWYVHSMLNSNDEEHPRCINVHYKIGTNRYSLLCTNELTRAIPQISFFVLVRVAVFSKYTMKGHVPALDSLSPAEPILFLPCAERKHSTSIMKI